MKASDIPDAEILAVIARRWQWLKSDRRGSEEPSPDKFYEARGVPLKVVMAKMKKLDDRGYLEWGVSLRTAWLSEDGEAVLAARTPLTASVQPTVLQAHKLPDDSKA